MPAISNGRLAYLCSVILVAAPYIFQCNLGPIPQLIDRQQSVQHTMVHLSAALHTARPLDLRVARRVSAISEGGHGAQCLPLGTQSGHSRYEQAMAFAADVKYMTCTAAQSLAELPDSSIRLGQHHMLTESSKAMSSRLQSSTLLTCLGLVKGRHSMNLPKQVFVITFTMWRSLSQVAAVASLGPCHRFETPACSLHRLREEMGLEDVTARQAAYRHQARQCTVGMLIP